MTDYIFPHDWPHEQVRLDHMSAMLNPYTLFRIDQLGPLEGWQCLEIGVGNGSVSRALSARVGARGRVLAVDLETDMLETNVPDNLDVRSADILETPLEAESFDLVCGRAVLHHIPRWQEVVEKLLAALRPGGYILFQEPDVHPLEAQDQSDWRDFWMAYVAWAGEAGIDYCLGRKLSAEYVKHGLSSIQVHGETHHFNGGSDAAEFFRLSMLKLEKQLISSGHVDAALFKRFIELVSDTQAWNTTYSFMAASARKPA